MRRENEENANPFKPFWPLYRTNAVSGVRKKATQGKQSDL